MVSRISSPMLASRQGVTSTCRGLPWCLVHRIEGSNCRHLVEIQENPNGLLLAGDENVDDLSAHGKLSVNGDAGTRR